MGEKVFLHFGEVSVFVAGKFYCHNSSAKNCSHASKKKFLSARKDFQWGQKKWTLAQNDSDLAKKVTTLKAISA